MSKMHEGGLAVAALLSLVAFATGGDVEAQQRELDTTMSKAPAGKPGASRPYWYSMTGGASLRSGLGFELVNPLIFFNSDGVLVYEAGATPDGGLMTITGTPLLIQLKAGTPPFDVTPSLGVASVSISAIIDEATGNLVSGVGGPDFELIGAIDFDGDSIPDVSGVLLRGEVTDYAGADTGTPSDQHFFQLDITDGALASQYAMGQLGINVTSESSSFTGSYLVDFAGDAKGTIGGAGCTGTIGDYVWRDNNGNGIQGSGDPGIRDVVLTLADASGTIIAMTSTATNGRYFFTELCAGTYTVAVDPTTIPAGFSPTLINAPGSNNANDSNDPTGTTVTLTENDSVDRTIDFGYVVETAGLGDFVWLDEDMDGVQDPTEPGIENVLVNLRRCNGAFVASTMTDATGFYQFTGLIPRCYRVEFIAPPGLAFTLPDQTDDAFDSDADPTTGLTPNIDLAPGEFNPDIDAGLLAPTTAELGDRFWLDTDGDGIQDPGEPGIGGVGVELLDCTGAVLATTSTNGSGMYLFTDLEAGCYQVRFTSPADCVLTGRDQGGDDTVDSDADGTGTTGPVNLAEGESNLTVDGGCYFTAGLGDFVWLDEDMDGLQDPGEPGIPGLTVVLLDAAMMPTGLTTVTGPAGEYEFTGLAPGDYFVQFTAPSGHVFTISNAGPDDIDSDANSSGKTAVVNLESGEFDPTIDAGVFVPPAPAITIEKATNGDDADLPTGPFVPTGDPVLWEYLVTNTGTATLVDVIVTDNRGVAVSCPRSTLAPGESMLCTGDGSADPGQYDNIGSVCGRDAQQEVCDDDPSHYFGSDPDIDIEKATNGEDADFPTGPFITPGESVTWTYVVTNTGNVTLTDVVVTDSRAVTVTCPLDTLEPGQEMTCVGDGTAEPGQYANVGAVVGTPPVGDPVDDEDPSHYFGALPAIDIEKATNGEDADLPTGPFVPVGDPVNWTYVVTNTGNVDLINVVVTDSRGVAVSCPADTLAVGDSFTCTANGTAAAGQYSNIGTVTGDPPSGPPVDDRDPSHYFGALPEIDLEKATNGEDADLPTGPFIVPGDPVTWTYRITNTGNVALGSITLIDDVLGPITCIEGAIPPLAPGAGFSCSVMGTAVAGQYANLGTVCGLDDTGAEVCDEDPSHYFGARPAIDIEKLTNGIDADDPNAGDAPELAPGDPVSWSYIVTNTGNVALDDVVVTDDQGVAVSCPMSMLDVGGSMTCTANGVAEDLGATTSTTVPGLCGTRPGQPLYENRGTATGTTTFGATVIDSDLSHYCNVEQCLVGVEKTCLIPVALPSDYTCEKPIDALTMIYTGSDPIRIRAWKGNVGATLLADIDGIVTGDEVTVTGYAGSPNDVIWEVYNAGTLSKIGESKFHLSCSDSEMNGPEDCGLPQGNGKSNESGLLNIWQLEGIVDAGGTLDCTAPAPTPGTSTCEFQPFPASCETTDADQLTFQYTGGGCAASDNDQRDHECSGMVDGAAAVSLTDDDGRTTLLEPGDTVTMRRDAAKELVLSNAGGAETNVLHTSCSQPLVAGDVYGSLTLVLIDGLGVGTDVEYVYEITNLGDVALGGLTAVDDQLGALAGLPASLAAGESATVSASAFLSETTTNTVLVGATTASGQACEASAQATVTVLPLPPCEVSGAGLFESFGGDTVKWELTNEGPTTITIESLELAWPAANGAIKEIKLDGTLFQGSLAPPAATLTSFVDDVGKRQLEPGETRKLEIKFDDDITGSPTDYGITVNFDEGCSVTFENTGLPFECNTDITELTMRWDGAANPIRVVAYYGSVGSTVLLDRSGVGVGDEVTVSGYGGSPNDVFWQVFSGGTLLGQSKFHLSCSDSEMDGADDCGKRQGNGKGNDSGLINDWILEGMVDADGPFDCSALP